MVDMGNLGNQPMGVQQQQPFWKAPQQQNVSPTVYDLSVNGEEEAMTYQAAPNTILKMWDTSKQSIYIKSVDMTGIPTMKILDYTVRKPVDPVTKENAISKEDFASLKDQVSALTKQLKELKKNEH